MSFTGEHFPPLKNDLLLRAAKGEETERAPVWVMRQAGRYLPEFRKIRETNEFFKICRTPSLAAEVTLQPIRRYSGLLDAAIIFCDILVIPQAMGLEVQMTPAPYFPDPLIDPSHMSRLTQEVDVQKELGYVFDALVLTRHQLKGEVPLIGFVGAPWTLMAYMVEGGGSAKGFQRAKTWLFKWPKESHELLKRITDVCVDFLVGQVKAGAQLLQVFDTWASELSPHHYTEFALPYYKLISSRVRSSLLTLNIPCPPLTLFAKGANASLGLTAKESGFDVLSLDWLVSPSVAVSEVSGHVALQGNIDPNVLYGGKEATEREVKRMCEGFKQGGKTKAWIANLGHGITPGVDPEDLKWFLECVHKYSRSDSGDV